MSFILDALKKLDHKRQRGSVPDLMTVHDPLPQEPKKRSTLLYLVLTALLLNAVLLAVWMYPRQTENHTIVQASSSTQPLASEPGHKTAGIKASSPAQQLSPDQVSGTEAVISEQESSPEPDSNTAMPAPSPVRAEPQAEPVQVKSAGQETVPDKPSFVPGSIPSESQPPAGIGVESAEKRVPSQGELPRSVQQELPAISITGHIYSNEPSSRIVNINGQILREGETVSAELKLEEITPNGVILNFRDYRFQIRTF